MNNQQSLADRLSASYLAYIQALKDFLSQGVDRISILKSALLGNDRLVAIYMLQYLSESELMELFNELVFLSSFSHGAVGTVRQAILRLPRDWVLSNIKKAAESQQNDGTDDEYRRFLELYYELDHNLTLKLAQRVVFHNDPDVREAGEDFINKLGETSSGNQQDEYPDR